MQFYIHELQCLLHPQYKPTTFQCKRFPISNQRSQRFLLIIHSVQKLLNTSWAKASLYITQPNQGQHLHSWYARLLSSGFPDKMMVMYVHEPSLMVVICKGKTIQGTWEPFLNRLERLLLRIQFPKDFIKSELSQAEGYTVSRTKSKSMFSFMNQMIFELEYDCGRFQHFDDISLDWLEDRMIDRPHQSRNKINEYGTPLRYWQREIGLGMISCKSVNNADNKNRLWTYSHLIL
jgi:hypothetical protein